MLVLRHLPIALCRESVFSFWFLWKIVCVSVCSSHSFPGCVYMWSFIFSCFGLTVLIKSMGSYLYSVMENSQLLSLRILPLPKSPVPCGAFLDIPLPLFSLQRCLIPPLNSCSSCYPFKTLFVLVVRIFLFSRDFHMHYKYFLLYFTQYICVYTRTFLHHCTIFTLTALPASCGGGGVLMYARSFSIFISK